MTQYLFQPPRLRLSKKSNGTLFSASLARSLGQKDARIQLYFNERAFVPHPPDELQWNVFSDRPVEPSDNALVIELSQEIDGRIPGAGFVTTEDTVPSKMSAPSELPAEPKKRYRKIHFLGDDDVLPYAWLDKEIFSKAPKPPQKCWLMVWW